MLIRRIRCIYDAVFNVICIRYTYYNYNYKYNRTYADGEPDLRLFFCSRNTIFADKLNYLMGGRTSGPRTRANIIEQSFKLFSARQYDQVTYPDIERATDLRRGSILYHFKSKQELFEAIVETMLLNWSAALDVPLPEGEVLKSFLEGFVDNYRKGQKKAAAQGIKNIHLAYYTIENTAFCYFNDFDKRLRQTRCVEHHIWTNVLTRAVEKGEIDGATKPEVWARLFMNLYYGYVYSAIRDAGGGNVELLREDLFALYDRVKKK